MTISTIGNNGLALTSPLPVLQGGTGVTTSTGTGNNVLSISPVLVTPNIGAATATSITGMSTPLSIAQGGTGFVDGTPMFRNRIINGGMVIDQRNAGASQNNLAGNTTLYTVDRFYYYGTQASKFNSQQNAGAITPPTGYKSYLGFTSTSTYSVLTSDFFNLRQPIEGYNVADLGFGTANASTVTVSFLVRSSLTGTFSGVLSNTSFTRTYPFTYSIPVANTWTNISITIVGDTTGTWATDNTQGLILTFSLGAGASYSGTAGSWSGSTYTSATGAVNVVGTSGATFYITGVQLEKGSVATSFDHRPYGTELSLCQRYFEKSYDIGTVPGTASGASNWTSVGGNQYPRAGADFKADKRATPTLVFYAEDGTAGYVTTWNGGTVTKSLAANANITTKHTASESDNATVLSARAYVYFNWTASAEL